MPTIPHMRVAASQASKWTKQYPSQRVSAVNAGQGNHNTCHLVTIKANAQAQVIAASHYFAGAFFLLAALAARTFAAQPGLTACRPRPTARASAGTSWVITEPEPI